MRNTHPRAEATHKEKIGEGVTVWQLVLIGSGKYECPKTVAQYFERDLSALIELG